MHKRCPSAVVAVALVGAVAMLTAGGGCSGTLDNGGVAGSDAGGRRDASTRDQFVDEEAGAADDTSVFPYDTGPCDWACLPTLPLGFTPLAHPPISENACTSQNVADYYSACVDPMTGSNATCDVWLKTAPACGSCLQGPSGSARWGPRVSFATIPSEGGGSLVLDNVGGCIDAQDLSSVGQQCGIAMQAKLECIMAACFSGASCCYLSNPDSIQQVMALTDCFGAAGAGPCSSFVNAATAECAAEADAGGPIAVCNELATSMTPQRSSYITYFTALCGGAPADAGGGGG